MSDFIKGLIVGAVISWTCMVALLHWLMNRYSKR